MLTCLAKNYQTYGLYKVWWSLYNIYQPCRIYRAYGLYKVWCP